MNKPIKCGCGGEAHHVSAGCWDPEEEEWMPSFWHKIICKNCGTQTKAFYTEAEAITAWNRAMGERTAKALSRELDAVVRFEEGGVTFTYDKGTSILHECESCGTFVKPGEIYCHNCGVRLEWE